MANDLATKLFEKLKVYKNYSNDCIFFKYIFDEKDLNDENSKKTEEQLNTFKPEFTHQIFGDEEIIFGYKNLRIDYYLTPGLLDAYIGLKCKEKITPQRFDGIEPDDVYAAFKDFGCSPGFTRNLDVFCSEKLKQDLEFKPFGEKIFEYSREPKSIFEIYKIDSSFSDYENKKFIDYILRVQTILVYFIETSCFVDTEDPNWVYYLVYEKKKNTASNGNSNQEYRYVTIGYLSVYNYYAYDRIYPDKMRSRISQILTFPKYQNAGHGAELVESVLRDAIQNSKVIDVTAESPSPEFIRLRDYVTTKMCSSLEPFKNKEKLMSGFSNEMAVEALKNFKIPKLQSRRCYEILRMKYTNQNNSDEWKNYRLDIKKRLFKPFLNKSKYARNAGTISNEEEQSDSHDNNKSKNSVEESGVTQIGFGTSSSSASVKSLCPTKIVSLNSRFETNGKTDMGTTIGFSSSKQTNSESSKAVAFSSSKTVSFSTKVTSLNTSNSTTENSNDSSDDEENNQSSQNQANLFISEKERKEYLEKSFQEAIADYNRVLKRLEKSSVYLS